MGSTILSTSPWGRAKLWWDLMFPWVSIQSGAMVPCTRYSAPTSSATLSKTLMNTSPMIFRFSSGSMTSSSLSKNSSLASTDIKLSLSLKVSSTYLASPSRIRPWSTKTAIKLSPMAFEASTDETELSIPPDNAIMAFLSPMLFFISSMDSFIKSDGFNMYTPLFIIILFFYDIYFLNSLQTLWKFSNIRCPFSVWCTSGWNWIP